MRSTGTFNRIEKADDLFHLGEENTNYSDFYLISLHKSSNTYIKLLAEVLAANDILSIN